MTEEERDESGSEKLLFMQEQMVSFVQQYDVPIIEVSLVLANSLRQTIAVLEKVSKVASETLPDHVMKPWPIEKKTLESTLSPDLDRLLAAVDEDRMDIFDTIIRSSIEAKQIPLVDATLLLREWEKIARERLAEITKPGQLFSPFEIKEGF
jgi:hypothetical protein